MDSSRHGTIDVSNSNIWGSKYFRSSSRPNYNTMDNTSITSAEVTSLNKAGLVQCLVTMIDGTESSFEIKRSSKGSDLLDLVCKSLDLLEKQYFGLKYRTNNNIWWWVNIHKKLSKKLTSSVWRFEFQLKFYPPEPILLRDELTRYLVSLQIRQDLISKKLLCSFYCFVLLAAYSVQSELGDYNSENPSSNIDYLKNMILAPEEIQSNEFLREVSETHKLLRGQRPIESDAHFLDISRRLALYGVEFHKAKDLDNREVMIGVCHAGILVYVGRLRVNRFFWAKITEVSYRRSEFRVSLRISQHETRVRVAFRCATPVFAKRLWCSCVEHHAFFRLRNHPQSYPSSSIAGDLCTSSVRRFPAFASSTHRRFGDPNHSTGPISSPSGGTLFDNYTILPHHNSGEIEPSVWNDRDSMWAAVDTLQPPANIGSSGRKSQRNGSANPLNPGDHNLPSDFYRRNNSPNIKTPKIIRQPLTSIKNKSNLQNEESDTNDANSHCQSPIYAAPSKDKQYQSGTYTLRASVPSNAKKSNSRPNRTLSEERNSLDKYSTDGHQYKVSSGNVASNYKPVRSNSSSRPILNGVVWRVSQADISAGLVLETVSGLLVGTSLGGYKGQIDPDSELGCRSTWGVTHSNRYYCEITVLSGSGPLRVGWSTNDSNLVLGSDRGSFGFGSASFMRSSQFISSGRRLVKINAKDITEISSLSVDKLFQPGDVIGCYLDLNQGYIHWSLNEQILSEGISIPSILRREAYFVTATMRDTSIKFNFGDSQFAYPPRGSDWIPVCRAPKHSIVPNKFQGWALNPHDATDGMDLDADSFTAQAKLDRSWQGVRSNRGVCGDSGIFYFEMMLLEWREVASEYSSSYPFSCSSGFIVGWSTEEGSLRLGQDNQGFGFGNSDNSFILPTSNSPNSEVMHKFSLVGGVSPPIGQQPSRHLSISKGDVVGCFIDLKIGKLEWRLNDSPVASISLVEWTDGRHKTPLFPTITLTDCTVAMNFGDAPFKFEPISPALGLSCAPESQIRTARRKGVDKLIKGGWSYVDSGVLENSLRLRGDRLQTTANNLSSRNIYESNYANNAAPVATTKTPIISLNASNSALNSFRTSKSIPANTCPSYTSRGYSNAQSIPIGSVVSGFSNISKHNLDDSEQVARNYSSSFVINSQDSFAPVSSNPVPNSDSYTTVERSEPEIETETYIADDGSRVTRTVKRTRIITKTATKSYTTGSFLTGAGAESNLSLLKNSANSASDINAKSHWNLTPNTSLEFSNNPVCSLSRHYSSISIPNCQHNRAQQNSINPTQQCSVFGASRNMTSGLSASNLSSSQLVVGRSASAGRCQHQHHHCHNCKHDTVSDAISSAGVSDVICPSVHHHHHLKSCCCVCSANHSCHCCVGVCQSTPIAAAARPGDLVELTLYNKTPTIN